jgi:gliding motility-associated-like protein
MNDHMMYDITWASDGNLYGIDNANPTLWLIDPNTAQTTPVGNFTGFFGVNAMTADNNGNIYTAGKLSSTSENYVGKLDIATMQITPIANLAFYGLSSAGDLSFVNGRLYLTCQGSKLALINISTGAVKVIPLINPPTTESMGLATLGNGSLFLSWFDKIYLIDPVSGHADADPSLDFNNRDINFSGLSNYAEHCNAPDCKASLDITILSALPYCSGQGVLLKGNGQGIRGNAVYEWITPQNDTIHSIDFSGKVKGMYYLNYYGVTDYCGAKDSIYLEIIKSPEVTLGMDTFLCAGPSIELTPVIQPWITAYAWQDGSSSPVYSVRTPGFYSLTVSNSCGSIADTILVRDEKIPQVDLGNDEIICPGSEITFKNNTIKQPSDKYTWSDGSTGENIQVKNAGVYWLRSGNSCGTSIDSVVVSYKDLCICFPFYPKVELGKTIELCNYESVELRNIYDESGFHYLWQDGNKQPSVVVKEPGIYSVQVSTWCATLTDSVRVIRKTSGCERKIMVPSAFTPDGNGVNDLFRPVVFGTPAVYEFKIFDRWGNMVFQSKTPGQGWNGIVNGKRQTTGLYVWTCEYRFSGENAALQKGKMVLIR